VPIRLANSTRRVEAGLGAVRRDDPGEFLSFEVDGPERRNDNEHPQSAYRRGFQQGAWEVMSAMVKAGMLRTAAAFSAKIHRWRYGKRKLKREVNRDRAPKLTLGKDRSR